MADYTYADIAGMIDHSLLSPALSMKELEEGCKVAAEYEVASVCILPYALPDAVAWLEGSKVLPTTTVGFPHGAQSNFIKLMEAEKALGSGAKELDMVINISKALSGDWEYVEDEIRMIVDLSHSKDAKTKVIFENCHLGEKEKLKLCEICGNRGADWVKTSTGYGSGGSTDEDLKLMRKHSPKEVQVKAAGGIRDLDALLRVRALGVTRVGASRTKDILDDCRKRLSK